MSAFIPYWICGKLSWLPRKARLLSHAESQGFQGPREVTSRLGQAGAGSVLFALHANEGKAWSKSKKGFTRANAQQVSLIGLEVALSELLGCAAKKMHGDGASEQHRETCGEKCSLQLQKVGPLASTQKDVFDSVLVGICLFVTGLTWPGWP